MSDAHPILVEHHRVGGDDARVTVLRLNVTAGPDAHVVTVELNRPETLNAIDTAVLDALDDALDRVTAAPSSRCLLVTGAGRAFSAGGDLTSYLTLQRDAEAFPRFVAHLHETFDQLILPVVTPLTVDPSHPFPYISNLSLNVGVEVRNRSNGMSWLNALMTKSR